MWENTEEYLRVAHTGWPLHRSNGRHADSEHRHFSEASPPRPWHPGQNPTPLNRYHRLCYLLSKTLINRWGSCLFCSFFCVCLCLSLGPSMVPGIVGRKHCWVGKRSKRERPTCLYTGSASGGRVGYVCSQIPLLTTDTSVSCAGILHAPELKQTLHHSLLWTQKSRRAHVLWEMYLEFGSLQPSSRAQAEGMEQVCDPGQDKLVTSKYSQVGKSWTQDD